MSIKMRFIYDSHHSFLQFYQTNKVSFYFLFFLVFMILFPWIIDLHEIEAIWYLGHFKLKSLHTFT